MEPSIIDYYNEEPQIISIIEQMNNEYALAIEANTLLEKENKRLLSMLNDLKAPSIIESAIDEEGYCELEDSLLDIFTNICGEDEENEELCNMFIESYQDFTSNKPQKEHSIIRRITDEINKVTGYKKQDWCFTHVLNICKDMGFDDEWLQPGVVGPYIDIDNLARNLANLEDISLPTIYKYN